MPLAARAATCNHHAMPARAQYVEFMLEMLPSKTTKSKPWKLSVRREQLCGDVIGHFSRGFTKQKCFQSTSVTFVDAHGAEEDGVDHGGLTAEMYASFFREVLLRDINLFEGVADDTGGGGSIAACCPSPTRRPPSSRPLVVPFASAPLAPQKRAVSAAFLQPSTALRTPVQVRA